MTEPNKVEIICSACGAEALLMREPRYEGFRRIGETLTCSACRHEYPSEEEVPFKAAARPVVFSDADRPAPVRLFQEGEADRLCRHCLHYVVNPFMQWCGVHRKEVEATDTCSRFKRKPDPKPPPP
ncbi:MAG TPA: hypothetical protein P5567_01410 [Kiritimatiellia bacterium]|nr:hypothetical protein [Kiritimatiellia bacterium]HRZ11093.1 hypothetical protein [Kiritimatiellia bacterium]HSA19735.1 hypothetical protein [Kiritimatiellia bacterium]